MLTRRQLSLLEFIEKRIREDGYPPSYDEMKEELKLKSKSGIHRLIKSLEERGFIERMENRARAIEVVKLPAKYGKAPPVAVGAGTPKRKEADWPAVESMGDLSIPLMGRIAAGSPIEAISTKEGDIGVPPHMVSGIGEHFALTVVGDSMIDAGIHHQDTAIIRRQSTADSGEIIVALIRGQEATLKRLRTGGNVIALEAANKEFETRVFQSDEITVQGKLVGLLRKY